MTNDTTPTENGTADAAALLAAMQTETTESNSDTPVEPKPPSFDDMGLHPDVKQALDDMGYFAPTPVQTAVFTPVSAGKNLLVQSRTGTGKTTAFGLPLVNKMVPTHRQPQALILAPTRELALQVARELTQIGKHRGIVIEAVYGGAPIGKQITALRNGVHIVVGTPGRVLDHIGRRTLDCKTISTFVLDECDEMLSMGFLEDIEKITSNLPDKHQTLLFSATMPDEVQRYARRHMQEREQISLSRDSVSVSDIHHAYYIVSGIARSRDLLKILYAENPESAIIFCNMRDETTMVAKMLQKQGLDAEPLSSDLSQSDRERVMARMKAKNLRFLCATDVAARGIDISNLSHVINFSVPESPEVYVHRTGRTGRAGKKGTALSLVGPRELGNFRYVRLQFGIKPEERLLPKDDIFIGKLKVPLPPVGVPQAPDPVQILMRGVTGTPSDLERSIFEKLLQKSDGKRVLAKLVADKLDSLSTKTTPRRQRAERPEGAEGEGGDRPRFEDRGERGERPRFGDRGDRPRFGGEGGERGERGDRDRGDRGDRPRFGDRGDRPRFGGEGGDRERPRFGADGERGPRPDGDRGPRPDGDRGPRPDGDRGDRPRFGGEGGDRERPRFGADGERGERDRGERGDRDRGERGDRPRFGGEDRGDRGERRFDRDRGDRPRFGDRDRGDRGDRPRFDRDRDRNRDIRDEVKTETAPAAETGVVEAVTTESSGATAQPVEAREPQGERHEGRGDRGDRGGRDRDRGDRGDRHEARGDRGDRGGRDRHDRDRDRGDRGGRDRRDTEMTVQDSTAPVEAAPVETVVETTVAPVEVPVASTGREDRHGKKKDKRGASEVTEATREFWETWAENKTPHAEKAAKPAADEATDDVTEEKASGEERTERKSARGERGGRGRDRDRGRGSKSEKSDKRDDDKRPAKKADEPARGAKRDTDASAAAAGDQARLFISLGKKHGVSAEDLRNLLAGPIGGDTSRIGSVSLRDSHAHVRVPEDTVDAIIAGVHGTLHNDHNVTVERARA